MSKALSHLRPLCAPCQEPCPPNQPGRTVLFLVVRYSSKDKHARRSYMRLQCKSSNSNHDLPTRRDIDDVLVFCHRLSFSRPSETPFKRYLALFLPTFAKGEQAPQPSSDKVIQSLREELPTRPQVASLALAERPSHSLRLRDTFNG
jgi:hypothetical protein